MQRMIGLAFAALALAATTVAGEIVDTNYHFRATPPDGWSNEATPGAPIALIIASPRKPETGGNCNVIVAANGLKGQSQADIDAQASREINEDFWKALLGAVKMFKSTKIENWGQRDRRGHKAYFVKATSEAEMNGVSATITQVQDLYPTPGWTYGVTCTARAAHFDREAQDFEAFMASFEPLPDIAVASLSASGRPVAGRVVNPRMVVDSAGVGAQRALFGGPAARQY